MEKKPHDSFAKIVIEKLARGREFTLEAELRTRVYADIVLRPGPAFPEWVGLLGQLFATGLTVLEVFHGRPRSQDLYHAQAKGSLALAAELERNPGFPGAVQGRVLLITIGMPRRAMKRCFRGAWETVERGYRRYEGDKEYLHLDLLRLAVNRDTAWAHVVGNSPSVDEALSLLFACGEQDAKALLYSIKEDVSFMPELQKSMPGPSRDTGAYRFLKAWEVAASKQEGLEKGLEKGREEGREQGREQGVLIGKILALREVLEQTPASNEGLKDLSLEQLESTLQVLRARLRS